MNICFNKALAESYKGPTQKIKTLSEDWFYRNGYCTACGSPNIRQFAANRPVADFHCVDCKEEYELKSLKSKPGRKVGDGAFDSMIERLKGSRNPNLLLLNYDAHELSVKNLILIPRHFFVPDVIQKRRPLSSTARRAGWVGCNILLYAIPANGRIEVIRDKIAVPVSEVLAAWHQIDFLRKYQNLEARGWLLTVMKCVERLNPDFFTLTDCYAFEDEIRRQYPQNMHVREKIRQQLQVLRDGGFLEFLGKGTYRLARRR